MKVDIHLKTKQAFWETPRNITILMGTVAAVAGYLGYKIHSDPTAPPQPIILQMAPSSAAPAVK